MRGGPAAGSAPPLLPLGFSWEAAGWRGRIPAPMGPVPPRRAKPGRPREPAPICPAGGRMGFSRESRALVQHTRAPGLVFPAAFSGSPLCPGTARIPAPRGPPQPHPAHGGLGPICSHPYDPKWARQEPAARQSLGFRWPLSPKCPNATPCPGAFPPPAHKKLRGFCLQGWQSTAEQQPTAPCTGLAVTPREQRVAADSPSARVTRISTSPSFILLTAAGVSSVSCAGRP